MISPIIQSGHKTLRQIAKPVDEVLFGTTKLNKILADMSKALATCDDGVALAAPQIDISLRIFIIAGKILRKKDTDPLPADKVFINPKLIKISRKKLTRDEGCLSVRWLYGKTKRAEKATVEAYDETGKKFTMGGGSFFAQIYQHEIDHLDGILFIDHATDVEEIKPEK